MTTVATAPMARSACQVGALEVVPHHTGALYLPSERTLLISDLHLEKGSSFAARGVFLPPYDTRSTLATVLLAVQAFEPRRIIAMGDSFHDRLGATRLDATDRASLRLLQAGRDWLWLTGNHDPDAAGDLPGEVAVETALADVRLVHEPSLKPGPEIAGHLHPAAKVRMRAKSVRRRCFVGDGTRLIMPAMGSLAGGLNVRDVAVRKLFATDADVWMLGEGRVFSISGRLLLPD